MAIGAIWQPPVDQQTYDKVREKIFQAAADNGLRFHAAGQSEGGWRIIEVWESQERLDRFIEETLTPAFEEIAGGAAPGGGPGPETFEVHFEGP